ncbi:MAG: hypothetical protein AMXMBFR13_24800 [Phycisphaerae bacterium]
MVSKPFHLLLVEDNPAHAKLATMAITHSPVPATVDRVADGEQALAYLRGTEPYRDRPTPNLVLLDLKAPRMDGIEVLQQIKADERLRSIPVVILSSTLSRAEAERAYQNYANSFLTKPMDYEEFQRMMTDLLTYWGAWNQATS